MQQTEYHTIRLSVSVKQVRLLVRFPCRLSFVIKTENSSAETGTTYELKKGECEVNEAINIDLDIGFDLNRRVYENKKVKLVVMMSSANGVIPAGVVHFNPCESQENLQRIEETLPLEKCPDRSATIKFSYWFEFLRTTTNPTLSALNGNSIGSQSTAQQNLLQRSSFANSNQPKYSTYTASNQQKGSKYSPIGVSGYQNQGNRPELGDLSPNNRLGASTNQMTTPRSRMRTYTSPIYENSNTVGGDQQGSGYQQQNYRMAESYMEPYQQHNATFMPNQSAFVPGGTNMQGSPISEKIDFSEKANFLKEIARLKGEIKSLHHEDKWEQLIRVKDENETLALEVDKQKEKYRQLEKKDREYNITIKELKDELERLKVKQSNSENLRHEAEGLLNEKEKKLKETLSESKKLEEKISDLNIALSTAQKRIEFKESSFQEQLLKLSEKYNQSEGERQSVTFEYNSLLSKMEENEKRSQLNSKEKERFFNEEKNKLNKKIEGLSQQLEKLREAQTDKEGVLGDLSTNYKSLQRRDVEKEQKLIELESELDFMRCSFQKEQEQRKSLESEVAILKQIEEERNALKKKYNETFAELSKLRESHDRLRNEHQFSTDKNRESEEAIKELKREKSQLNSRINILAKEVEERQKSEEKRAKEQEQLSAQNMNTNQRINDLRSKLETEQRDFSEIQSQYEEQIGYLAKSKEYLETEVEDLKWNAERHREQYGELEAKLRESTEEVLLLNRDLLQWADKHKHLEEELKESQGRERSLEKEKRSREEKERQLQEELKAKSNESYEQSKRLLELEQELYLVKEQHQQLASHSQDKSLTDEKQLKEREKEITHLQEEGTKLELEILGLKEEITLLGQNLSIKNHEAQHLRDGNQALQGSVNELELKNESLREELRNCNFDLTNLREENELTRREADSNRAKHAKLKADWEDYHLKTTKALEQLIAQISQDPSAPGQSSGELLSFPDMNISSMQVEAIKKRNGVIAKYTQRVEDLEKEGSTQEITIKKLKVELQETEALKEFIQLKEKEKYKALLGETSKERDELTTALRKVEERNAELNSENEKLNNEVKRHLELIEEAKVEAKELVAEKEHLRLEIKNLEEKLMEVKSNEIKVKASHESKYSELNEQSEQEIFKLKGVVMEHEKRHMAEEKALLEREEQIKKLENQIATLTYERDRNDQKCIEVQEKLQSTQEEKKASDKKIKTLEKELKEQSQLYLQASESTSNEKSKLEQIRRKYNETFEELTDSQVDNEKLKQEIELCTLTIESLEAASKERDEKYKNYQEKSQQEIKQLKESIITLNSDLELKGFITKQNEEQIAKLKNDLNETKSENEKKKTEVSQLQEELQKFKNDLLHLDQSLTSNKNEKTTLLDELERYRSRVNSLENDLNENRMVGELLEMRDSEIRKLRDEVDTNRRHYEKSLSDMRISSANRGAYGGNSTSRVVGSGSGEENPMIVKRKVRELEQMLELKHYDLAMERKKWQNQAEKERRAIIQENKELCNQIEDMQNEFDFQRAQLNKEIQGLSQECGDLTRLNEEKEEIIYVLEKMAKQLEAGPTNSPSSTSPTTAKPVRETLRLVDSLRQKSEDRINEDSIRRAQNSSLSSNYGGMGPSSLRGGMSLNDPNKAGSAALVNNSANNGVAADSQVLDGSGIPFDSHNQSEAQQILEESNHE